jgi:hypothetical protein
VKIYLILEYKKDIQNNVWAEVTAYTSPTVRDDAYAAAAFHTGADVEKQDIEVQKRPYKKTQDVLIADLVETKVAVNG